MSEQKATTLANGLEYLHIVPIERGPDKTKWKAPQAKNWNDDGLAAQYPNYLYDGWNGGICHKQSGTCAIDIDNLQESHTLFEQHGLKLSELLMKGCQIQSGKANRSKLLYRLPQDIINLGAYPRTRQIANNQGMILEFRCVYSTGKTCQDVAPGSIHPETGEVYKWINYEKGIPEIPPELLKWWYSLIPRRQDATSSEWSPTPDTPDVRQKISRALAVLDPNLSYPEWRDVGVAIHDTGWPDAFEIWDQWSSGGVDYDYSYCQDKWDDMRHGAGINLNWLYSLAYRETGNSHTWDRPSAEEMFSQVQQSQPAPVTIEHTTQAPTVDVMKLCEDLQFNPPQEKLQQALAHVAAEPDVIMRETYIRVISDQTHVSRPAIRQRINEMVSAATIKPENAINWHQVNESGAPLSTVENFALLMHHHQYSLRYNSMCRSIEVDRPDIGRQIIEDAKSLGMLTELKSLALEHGMRTDMIKDYRDYIAYCNSYHPFHVYLDEQALLHGAYNHLREPDYIQQLCDTLIVDDEHIELRNTLVRTWIVSVVAAAYMTWDLDKPPVRGVLVLQGPQSIGKSHWFHKLLPHDMVKSGSSINRHDMNHLKTATNRLVVELAEAEFSRNNMDMVAYLKSIVGRSVDELRKAYDAEEVRLLRRSVFCITTNPGTFLVDDENSRYFTVPCNRINQHAYNNLDMNRLWLQAKFLYDAGTPYLLDELTLKNLQDLNEEHREKSFFEDWLLDSFHFDTLEGQEDQLNWVIQKQLVLEAQNAHAMDVRPGEMRDILKRLTKTLKPSRTWIDGVNGRWWKFPKRRSYTPV